MLWAAIVAVIALVGFAVVRSLKQASSPRGPIEASPAPAGSPPGASPAVGPAAHTLPARVTRLASPAQRQEVADRIASAHAARARQAPPQPPSLPGAAPSNDPGDTSHDLERASPTLKAALTEAIPFLAECYKTAPITQRRPAVQMTLTGDPDVGTLIDAEELRDQDGRPLDPELDGCLRTTLGSLELPPLPSANPLHLQYSFRFDED